MHAPQTLALCCAPVVRTQQVPGDAGVLRGLPLQGTKGALSQGLPSPKCVPRWQGACVKVCCKRMMVLMVGKGCVVAAVRGLWVSAPTPEPAVSARRIEYGSLKRVDAAACGLLPWTQQRAVPPVSTASQHKRCCTTLPLPLVAVGKSLSLGLLAGTCYTPEGVKCSTSYLRSSCPYVTALSWACLSPTACRCAFPS